MSIPQYAFYELMCTVSTPSKPQVEYRLFCTLEGIDSRLLIATFTTESAAQAALKALEAE